MLNFRLMTIRLGSYSFSPKLIPTIATLLLLYLLYSLGQWQLSRAEEKEAISNKIELRSQLAPVELSLLPDDLSEIDFRQVKVSGEFDSKSFLLDNKVINQQAGYEVITPYKTSSGLWMLIDRGWVPQVNARENLPEFETPVGEIKLSGFVRVPYKKVYMLADQHYDLTRWPVVIQSVNIEELRKVTGLEFLPYMMFLNKTSAAGFNRDWHVYRLDSQKHIGYAVQWFAMFCALLFIFFLVNTRRTNNDDE